MQKGTLTEQAADLHLRKVDGRSPQQHSCRLRFRQGKARLHIDPVCVLPPYTLLLSCCSLCALWLEFLLLLCARAGLQVGELVEGVEGVSDST